jgi:mono/diheme cytochrome c family protein
MRSRRALVLLLATGTSSLAAQAVAPEPEGAQVFQMVCSMCHTVNPPPKAAPPMSHATGFYLRQHQTIEAAAAAIVAYLKQPDSARSALPAHAITRFGLMPSQAHLTDLQLDAVARYVLTLADTTHQMPMGPPGAP